MKSEGKTDHFAQGTTVLLQKRGTFFFPKKYSDTQFDGKNNVIKQKTKT